MVSRSPVGFAPSDVWEVVESSGRPLAAHERPSTLGIDLSGVRVHTGARAARSARMLAASAYAVGDDIVLGDPFDSRSAANQRLVAHELAHVADHRIRSGPLVVYRQGAKTAKAPKAVVFIIAKPGDEFIKDWIDYTKTTLHGQEYHEVANLDDVGTIIADEANKGATFSRIDIVSHGQSNIGGVGETPAGEKKWRFVTPDEVLKYASSPEFKVVRSAMAPAGEVRFLGCYIGGVPAAGEAFSKLFGAPVSSTSGEMRIQKDDFVIDKKGTVAGSSSDVPKRSRKLFEQWLLAKYQVLKSTAEAPKIDSRDRQITYMTELFDRSGGKILTRVVEDEKHQKHRPGEKAEIRLWHRTPAPTP